jgi:hypothetical protein
MILETFRNHLFFSISYLAVHAHGRHGMKPDVMRYAPQDVEKLVAEIEIALDRGLGDRLSKARGFA